MNNIVNEIAMTIFPELQNPIDPPQTYFSENQIKIRAIELVSDLFREKMGDRFNKGQLIVFLTDKKEDFYDMFGDLIAHYNNYVPAEEENTDQHLENTIDGYIGDIDDWIWEFVI